MRTPITFEPCYDPISGKTWWFAQAGNFTARGETVEATLMNLCRMLLDRLDDSNGADA